MTNKWQRWKGIMKAYPFEEKRLAKWQPPYIVQPKYDGVRCRAIPLDNGEFMLLSSEENVIYSIPHINKACQRQLPQQEFDGELYLHSASFEQIISITSRTVNLHSDYQSIQYHIFDFVFPIPQVERIKSMNNWKMENPLVRAPFWPASNLEDIMRIYDHLISQDYEGIIVRHYAAPYERKRSIWMMKFKPKQEDAYEILGWQEEFSTEGTPKGCLGALVCRSGDGHTFSVGTGFSNDHRKSLWERRESLPGCIARVQYQHLTTRKNVPRFPVFMEVVENE